MRYCPYCGASILDDAAFCMECGATIPVSGIPKDEPKQRAPQTKKKKRKPKPVKQRQDAPPPDPQDSGYDGYYALISSVLEAQFAPKRRKAV